MSTHKTGAYVVLARTGLSLALAASVVGGLATASQAVTTTQQAVTLSSVSGPTAGGNTITMTLASTAAVKFTSGNIGVQLQATTAVASATATCTQPASGVGSVTADTGTGPYTAPQADVRYLSTTKASLKVPATSGSTSTVWLVCVYNRAASASGGTALPAGTTLAPLNVIGRAVYTVAAAPTLDATTPINPTNGPASGGQTVTITGTNFDVSTPTATLGGAALTNIVVLSATAFTATTPAHAASNTAVPLVVNTLGGTVTSTLGSAAGDTYKYQNGITVSPNTVPTGQKVDIDVQGSGFNALTFVDAETAGVTSADHTDAGTNSSTSAHVYLVQPTQTQTVYSTTGYAAGVNKALGQVTECTTPAVISDTELICTVDTTHYYAAVAGVYTWTATNTVKGAYTVTVVNTGYTAPTFQTPLSSGATFTVSDF